MSGSRYQDLKEQVLRLLDLPRGERRRRLEQLKSDAPTLHAELADLLGHHENCAAILDADLLPAAPVPRRLGPYLVREVIGEGGMGVVYRADQTAPIRRPVAIKHVRLGMDTARIVARFQAESQALARMSHPNIATVHDAGSDDRGRPYFVMELVDGIPINRWCEETNPSREQRLDLFLVLCGAIQHAHQKGVIHRDLKPGNLLVGGPPDAPCLKVIDFGIAKALDETEVQMTRPGLIMGTPHYMSPEQFGAFGGGADTRTDVYALGVILHELLTGEPPLGVGETSPARVRRAVLEDDPTRPRGLPADLANIVLMALRKDPDRRYSSVDQLAADIGRFRRGEPVAAHPDSWRYRSTRFMARNRLAVAASGALLIVLVAFTATVMWQAEGTRRQRNRALEAEHEARVEAETAREVSDFLVGLFAEASPDQNPTGAGLTVREAVDAGARRIDRDLRDQPAIRWRLLQVLGEVYAGLGRMDSADTLLNRTLTVQEQVFGPEHAEIAATLERLGTLAHSQGDYDLAVARFRRALAMQERVAGPGTAQAAYYMNALAIALEARGDYGEARPLYEDALALNRKLLGDEDPEVAWGLNTLGQSRWRLGDYAAAQVLFEEAVSLSRRIFDGPHPDLQAALNNLGGCQRLNGQLDLSLATLEEALAGYQAIYPEGHPGVARAQVAVGATLLEQERAEEALPHFERGAALMARTAGEEHVQFARALAGLGRCRLALGKTRQGLADLEAALGIARATVGDRHPVSADLQLALAEGLTALGRHEQAMAAARAGLQIRQERLEAGHPLVADARLQLAATLAAAGLQDEARSQGGQALTALAAGLGPDHHQTTKGKARLSQAGLPSP